jgi:hypothetical protein
MCDSYLGTVHHEFTFTVQQGLDALRDVIYHLETFDCTTIRGMSLLLLFKQRVVCLSLILPHYSFHTHVFALTQNPSHGHQDGVEWRRQ